MWYRFMNRLFFFSFSAQFQTFGWMQLPLLTVSLCAHQIRGLVMHIPCNRFNFRAVFKSLSKNRYQSYHSTNQFPNSWSKRRNEPIGIRSELFTCNFLKAREKSRVNRTYKVPLLLVLLSIGWKIGARFLIQSLNVPITISY